MATKPTKERLTASLLVTAARAIEARPQGHFTTSQLAEATGRDWSVVRAALELMEAEFEKLNKAGCWRVKNHAEGK